MLPSSSMCDVQAQAASDAVLSSSVTAEESETQVSVLSDTAVSLIEACEFHCEDPTVILFLLAARLPDSDPDKPFLLAYAGDQCIDTYNMTGQAHFLDTAIISYKTSVQSFQRNTHIPEIYQHISLADLGTAHSTRYDLFGKLSDLDSAIDALYTALKRAPLDDRTELFKLQRELAALLLRRYDKICSVTDLKSSVSILQKLWMASPGSNLSVLLNNLAGTLQDIFESTQDDNSLCVAIILVEQALRMLGDSDSPHRSLLLTTHGITYFHLYERKGKLSDLDIAISYLDSAVKTGGIDHDVPFNNLACALLSRYEHLRDPEDLERAIQACKGGVSLASKHPRLKARNLGNLGLALLHKFEHERQTEAINSAIKEFESALHLLYSPLDIAKMTGNLSKAFLVRFRYNQDLQDLERATELGRKIQLLMADISNTSGVFPGLLTNLGSLFLRRFESLSQLSDIDEAVFSLRRAVGLTPKDHRDLGLRLINLGNALILRFQLLQEKGDIDEALELQRTAIESLSEPDHQHILFISLTNYGNALMRRSEYTKDIEDAHLAVQVSRRAVEVSMSASGSSKVEVLHNAAIALLRLHDFTEQLREVDEAISYFERAISHTSLYPDAKQHILSSFGNAYMNRFETTHSLEDLNKGINLSEQSVNLAVKSNNPFLGGARLNLAKSLMKRYDLERNLDDFRRAVLEYKIVAWLPSASPSVRLDACQRLASVSEDIDEKLAVYEIAFQQVPHIVWLGQSISTRQVRIRATIQGVSSAAASTALTAGKKEVAVQWLEQGRAIIWNQLTMLRSPFDELIQKGYPELVEEFKYISGQLERTAVSDIGNLKHSSIAGDIIQEEYVQAGHRWAEKWDQLLKKSRDKDGLGDFLKAPTLAQIFGKLANVDGFAIMINCCPERCDALALDLHSKKLVHISLPDFSFKKVLLLRMEMLSCLEQHGLREARKGRAIHITEKNNGSLKNILKVLWNDIIKPIIDTLHLKKVQSQYKRIWWCPTGPLSFLPIHAAGIYSGIEKVSVAEFAVSSYIPALSSLGRTFKRMAPNISCKSLDMLVITQAITPDLPPIPSAEVESVDIIKQFTTTGLHCTHLNGERATVEAVLREMSTHRFVHFACHALQDARNPIKSAFYLHGGTLSLSQIFVKKYPNAEFAFLSACQTGMGDEQMSEEAVHLAGGMIAAGYTSVLATMWSIIDEKTPLVVNIIYEELLRSTENICAAEALHRAGIYLIESLGCEDLALLTWVPFIHTGV